MIYREDQEVIMRENDAYLEGMRELDEAFSEVYVAGIDSNCCIALETCPTIPL